MVQPPGLTPNIVQNKFSGGKHSSLFFLVTNDKKAISLDIKVGQLMLPSLWFRLMALLPKMTLKSLSGGKHPSLLSLPQVMKKKNALIAKTPLYGQPPDLSPHCKNLRDKHSSLFLFAANDEENRFIR